ncbi:hypothetical protein ACFSCX_11780 [Bacillus salitolerans]|uniref:Lipoprotein n=1 Tax=Bacillus salitolerans TaxID=1437434 RepID=A0ABW4LRT4_9BACI
MNRNSFNFCKLLLVILFVYLVSGCSNEIIKIEVFSIDTLEETEKGTFEITGFKKVNVITTINKSETHLNTDVKKIEDFYVTNGKYIKTLVKHTIYKKNDTIKSEDVTSKEKEFQSPKTILIPKDIKGEYKLESMDQSIKEQVEQHVLSLIKQIE